MTVAYIPARDPVSKVRRRFTQWRAVRPTRLIFREPMLSICFDDFPATAADEGARILESHGARGTYYASAGLAGSEGPCGRNYTPDQLRRLATTGHEIGCHSHDHQDAARRDTFSTLNDLARNRDALAHMGAPAPQSLAYPFGETTTPLKEALPPRFESARGILPGLNRGQTDLAQLRAFALFGDGAMVRAHAALKRVVKYKAWMIAFTHDVSDTPSAWGTRGEDLDGFIKAAKDLGINVLPVSAALAKRRK